MKASPPAPTAQACSSSGPEVEKGRVLNFFPYSVSCPLHQLWIEGGQREESKGQERSHWLVLHGLSYPNCDRFGNLTLSLETCVDSLDPGPSLEISLMPFLEASQCLSTANPGWTTPHTNPLG